MQNPIIKILGVSLCLVSYIYIYIYIYDTPDDGLLKPKHVVKERVP
jgi:hypothetical protein